MKSLICISLALALIAVILAFSGCGNMNPINPPPVSAAGPLPFPAIPASGGTITLEPGTYSCPASIPSSTHIIGHGSIVPPELLLSDFAPIAASGTIAAVRVVCNQPLTIRNAADVEISGVVFDFQGSGGLVLDSVAYSKFDIGITDAVTALTLTTTNGNTLSNSFPRLVLFKNETGIVLKGINSKGVTWNDFGTIDIVKTGTVGIVVSQFADTNRFGAVRMHLLGSAQAGVIFNDAAVIGDVDASGNVFSLVNCDVEPGFAGFCADFRGNTVGNNVTMGFGIMADENKIHFANAFSQSANIVTKMQEHPKQ